MELIEHVFGVGKDLNSYQMAARSVVVFVITLLLLRISGRRSFKNAARQYHQHYSWRRTEPGNCGCFTIYFGGSVRPGIGINPSRYRMAAG